MQLTDVCERDTAALHRVSWRSVWFVEVEKVIIDLSLKPFVTLQEVGLPWLRVHRSRKWYFILFVHSHLS
jgi:hypothetical protein